MEKETLKTLKDQTFTENFYKVNKYTAICYVKSLQLVLLGESENLDPQRNAVVSVFDLNSRKLISNFFHTPLYPI